MLSYNRIDVSEGIDINKTSASKKCDICHYWYFLNKGFTFQPNVCNECHDVLMSVILSDAAILNIRRAGYRCTINGISKSDAVSVLENVDMTEGREVL